MKQTPSCLEAKASDLIENVCQSAECEIAQVENGIFGCVYVMELAAMGCYDKFSELPCSKIQLSKWEKMRNMGWEQFISIVKDAKRYVLWC